MLIGVPKEILPGECRVAATPRVVERLRKLGFEVVVQAGAGIAARYADADYEAAGAQLVQGHEAVWDTADVVIHWPDGTTQLASGLALDAEHRITWAAP